MDGTYPQGPPGPEMVADTEAKQDTRWKNRNVYKAHKHCKEGSSYLEREERIGESWEGGKPELKFKDFDQEKSVQRHRA